jgi:hypothetical protein
MTKQEIFDKVAAHLLTQRRQSVNDCSGACVYRSPEGLKCAAGCLIPDDDPALVTHNKAAWVALPYSTRKRVLGDLVQYADDDRERLISRLQRVHDFEESWKEGLVKRRLTLVAKDFSLDHSILNNYEDL